MDDDGEVIVSIGLNETTPGPRPNVARAHGGFGCNACGLICGWVDTDGRCQSCGPLPKETTPQSEHDAALERERRIAEQIRRNRL